MEENILESIKDLLGIYKEDEAFDNDVLININAVLSTLYQLGVGSEGHYVVLNGTETWNDLFEEEDLVDFVKLYVYMKVKLVFDPPTNSSILQALNEQAKELEYRILLQADSSNYFDYDDDLRCNHKMLTEEELIEMWKDIIGNHDGPTPDRDSMSDEDIKELWDEIMNKGGGI